VNGFVMAVALTAPWAVYGLLLAVGQDARIRKAHRRGLRRMRRAGGRG
jgi:hypothetical protein